MQVKLIFIFFLILFTFICNKQNGAKKRHQKVYNQSQLDEDPIFNLQFSSFENYIELNKKWPTNEDISYRVLVQFQIDTKGKVTEITIIKGTNKKYNNEAIRLLEHCPSWTPGKIKNQPVTTSMLIEINWISE